jgi:hypothetical protein
MDIIKTAGPETLVSLLQSHLEELLEINGWVLLALLIQLVAVER